MLPLPLLALLRRATWRRFGVALALAALLAQTIAVAAPLPADPAPWHDAAICTAGGNAGADPGDDPPARGHAACPLCPALHHLGKLPPPPELAAILPPPAARPAPIPAPDAAIGARVDRPHLARGPPIPG